MKMLRVVLVVSNFLEAPNGVRAGGNRGRPARSVYANGATVGASTRTPMQTIRAPWHCGHASTDCVRTKLQRCGAPGGRRISQGHKLLLEARTCLTRPAATAAPL